MKKPLKVELHSNLVGLGSGRLIIGGKDVTPYVKGFNLSVSCDDVTSLAVEFINIDVKGEVEAMLEC